LTLLSIGSCYTEDKILDPIAYTTVDLRVSNDINQATYLKLSDKQITNDSSEVKWHLKFENDKDKWQVLLNPLENVVIYSTSLTNFNEVDSNYNLVGLEWQTDAPNQSSIQSAIGNWGDFAFSTPKSFKNVFIVRVKNDLTAQFYKMQLLDAHTQGYRLRYSTLNGQYDHTILIKKDDQFTHSYLRLGNSPSYPVAEPKRKDWDVCFTYLADSISRHGKVPHLKTINQNFGVYHAIIINQEFVEIAVEGVADWDEIDYFYARKLDFMTTDQITNSFLFWNDKLEKAELLPNTTVLLRVNEDYYKIRGKEFFGEFPTDFTLRLALQKL
jgi:hypothetical protein